MRIAFLGTGELACPCLEAVANDVVLVITQPDRPKGRDLRPGPPPVKVVAQRLNLTVNQPEKIREPVAIQALRDARPDLLVIVAYGQILPRDVLEIAPRGCINVHTSLLPRWRGAAPIQYAILHGDRETGVTTMFVNERMDAGDIILQRAEPIRPDDTSATLHNRLAKLGAALLIETVGLIARGSAPRLPQDEAVATYAKKLTKADGRVDWTKSAMAIERQIRAFDPWPGAYTFLGDTMIRLCKAVVVGNSLGAPGQTEGRVVGTGDGGLRLLEVQPAGGKRMDFDAFLRGHKTAGGVAFH